MDTHTSSTLGQGLEAAKSSHKKFSETVQKQIVLFYYFKFVFLFLFEIYFLFFLFHEIIERITN